MSDLRLFVVLAFVLTIVIIGVGVWQGLVLAHPSNPAVQMTWAFDAVPFCRLPALDSICQLPTLVILFDVLFLLTALVYGLVAGVAWWLRSAKPTDDSERQLAVSAMSAALNTTMMANSVLLAGVGIMTQLDPVKNNHAALTQMVIAGLFFVAALVWGTFSSGYLVSRVHFRKSVAENAWVMGSSALSFASTTGGALCLGIVVFLL